MVRKTAKAIPQVEAKIPQIMALSRYTNTSVAPTAKFDPKLPIIPYFKEDGNGFIGTLTEILGRSAMHKACILIKHVIACGDGLVITRKDGNPYVKNEGLEQFLSSVNGKETADHVVKKMLLDQILTSMHSVQVAAETSSGNINTSTVSVTHEDISKFRLGIPADGEVTKCYLSYCWGDELKKYDPKQLEKLAIELPLFDGTQEKSIIHYTSYETGRYWYALPDYFTLEFKRWADIAYAIPTYNFSRIENKFMPSGMLTAIGMPPEGMTPAEYCQALMDRFTGEGNNSRMVVNLVSEKDARPIIEQFNDAPDGIFNELSELGTAALLRAHRMHPTILMSTAGSLGQANELRTIFELFYKNVIEGYQKPVLETWDKILDFAGFGEYRLDIANNNPISLLGNIDLSRILDVNEIRTELGYAEKVELEKKTSLADRLGSENVRLMQSYLSDINLTREQKKGSLKLLFGLEDAEADLMLPLIPMV